MGLPASTLLTGGCRSLLAPDLHAPTRLLPQPLCLYMAGESVSLFTLPTQLARLIWHCSSSGCSVCGFLWTSIHLPVSTYACPWSWCLYISLYLSISASPLAYLCLYVYMKF